MRWPQVCLRGICWQVSLAAAGMMASSSSSNKDGIVYQAGLLATRFVFQGLQNCCDAAKVQNWGFPNDANPPLVQFPNIAAQIGDTVTFRWNGTSMHGLWQIPASEPAVREPACQCRGSS